MLPFLSSSQTYHTHHIATKHVLYWFYCLTYFSTGSTSPPRDLFSCELCPKTFLHIEALRSHAKNHLLACLDCNKSFADQSGLTKHQEEVSPGLVRKYLIVCLCRCTHRRRASTAASVTRVSKSCAPSVSTSRYTTLNTRSTVRSARRALEQNGR